MSTETTVNLRMGGVDYSPSIGSAELLEEEVKPAIDALIKEMTPAFLKLMAESSDINQCREKIIDSGFVA